MTEFDRSVGADARGDVIAVAASAWDSSAPDLPLAAAPDLAAQFLHIERAHRADEADVQFGNAVVGAGEQCDAGEFEAAIHLGRVAQVAGNAVKRFGKDDVEVAPIGGGQHGVEAGAVLVLSGDGRVGKCVDDVPALAFSVGPAQPDLVFRRQRILHVGAEAGVDCDAAPFRCPAHSSNLSAIRIRVQHPPPPCPRQWPRRGRGC
ncbi:hypothetical protein NUH86_01540 [Sphingobium sp. JS3065]|nr:hypothetical protein [Sphingobium sp. JS3065]UZW55513.1 hypothetical protein NUH86_01540 [Sphingobium sp. JS3065]